MRRPECAAIGAFLVLLLGSVPLGVSAQSVCPVRPPQASCGSVSASPRTPSPRELALILDRHELWVRSGESRGGRANLTGARLAGVDLRGKDLRRANLIEADLSGANLEDAKLHGADLQRAKLRCAALKGANLEGADLSAADLSLATAPKAILREANLSAANLDAAALSAATLNNATLTLACLREANLSGAKLIEADLIAADLSGADLTEAVLSQARLDKATLRNVKLKKADLSETRWDGATVEGAAFEPARLPAPEELARVQHLELLRFERSPFALQLLRDQLRTGGFREEAREVTSAINESLTARQIASAFWREWAEGQTRRVGLGWTTCYGLCPERPLLMILGAVFACALIYLAPLISQDQDRAGIWKVPNREWMTHDVTQARPPERMSLAGLTSRYGLIRGLFWFVGVALYFSFLSALAIGRQDVQATVWITRIQPGEYSLRPTGWVRSLSGLQSLASVVFVALAAGSYLGRLLD